MCVRVYLYIYMNLKREYIGITIESKETSKYNFSWIASYFHACTNETHLIYDLIPTLGAIFIGNTN